MIIENGTVYPIEIKKHTATWPGEVIRHFSVTDGFGLARGPGAVICNSKNLLPIKGNDWMVPYPTSDSTGRLIPFPTPRIRASFLA